MAPDLLIRRFTGSGLGRGVWRLLLIGLARIMNQQTGAGAGARTGFIREAAMNGGARTVTNAVTGETITFQSVIVT